MLGFWCVFTASSSLLGWYAFRLDGESPRVLWAMPLQQFVYRQLMYLVVIESVLTALQGTRLRWRPIARRGEIEVEARLGRGRTRSRAFMPSIAWSAIVHLRT